MNKLEQHECLELAKKCGFEEQYIEYVGSYGLSGNLICSPEELLAYTSAIEEKHQAAMAELQNKWAIARNWNEKLRQEKELLQKQIAMLRNKFEYIAKGKQLLDFEEYVVFISNQAISATQATSDAFIAEVKAGVWKDAEKICLRLQNEAENLRFKQNRDSQRFAYGEAAAEFSERAAELRNQVKENSHG